MNRMLHRIIQYRFFILSSIRSEFRARFIRSRLGGLWMVIHPLAQASIFALVLTKVVGAKLPGMADSRFAYTVYLLSGTLAWSLFSEVLNRSLTLFIDHGQLLKKMAFPPITLPLIMAGSAFTHNLLLFVANLVVFLLLGHYPGVQIMWVPLLMVLTLALGLGLGMILGVLNVFIRDIGQVIPVVLQLGFWLTPIVYSVNSVPEGLRPLLRINPMTAIVDSFRNTMLFNTTPDFLSLGWLVPVILILLSGALFLFRRASAEIVDVL